MINKLALDLQMRFDSIGVHVIYTRTPYLKKNIVNRIVIINAKKRKTIKLFQKQRIDKTIPYSIRCKIVHGYHQYNRIF